MTILITFEISESHFFECALQRNPNFSVSKQRKIGPIFKKYFTREIEKSVVYNFIVDPKSYQYFDVNNSDERICDAVSKNRSDIIVRVRIKLNNLIKFYFKYDNNKILKLVTIFDNNFKNIMKFLKKFGISNKTHILSFNGVVIDDMNLYYQKMDMIGGRTYEINCESKINHNIILCDANDNNITNENKTTTNNNNYF